MDTKKRNKYIEDLKKLRSETFEDKSEMQTLRRNDYRYDETMDVQRKAKKMLDKENGIS